MDFITLQEAAILLAIVTLAPLANYVLRRGRDPFNPLVFIGGVVFAVSDLKLLTDPWPALYYLPPWALKGYLLITTVSMLSLYAGWYWWGRRNPNPVISPARAVDYYRREYDPNRMLVVGIIYGFIALAVFGVTHNQFNSSGYFRDLTFLSDPAAILLLQAIMLDGTLFWTAVFGIAAATARFVIGVFTYGSRGGFFEFCVLATVPFLVRGRRPARLPMLAVGCVVALTLGSLAESRTILGRGEAPNRLAAIWVAAKQIFRPQHHHYSAGREFIVGAGEVDAVLTMRNWDDGGIIWDEMVLFLPHEWFPNKANLYTDWGENKHNGYLQQIRRVAGVQVPLGCAPTGFANVFVEVAWFFPMVWFLAGYALRDLYGLGVNGKRLNHQGYLTLAFIWYLYLVTQDLNAVFQNLAFTFAPLWLAYHWCRVAAPARQAPVQAGVPRST